MKQRFQDGVVRFIREHALMNAGDRVGVAVSGGPDSVALLRMLLELRADLGIVVAAVVHFNHQLRGKESEADERFVRALAEKHGLEFLRAEGDTAAAAETSGEGVEAAARKQRYEFFADVLRAGNMDCIATGHTLDDQAETVLMRVLRGAGTRGLAAIRPMVRIVEVKSGEQRIVRPVLGVRRADVVEYLRGVKQDFREDASNRDPRFLRNRIRHELLPLLERGYNPQIAEALAQMAEIARAEEQHSERELSEAWREVARWKAETATPGKGRGVILAARALARLPLALQRRILQQASEKLGVSPSFEQIEAVRGLLGKTSGRMGLARGVEAQREKDELRLWVGETSAAEDSGYQYLLAVPGEVVVRELGSRIAARKAMAVPPDVGEGEGACAYVSNGEGLTVRNWRAGDRFYPQHSSGPKKVKELLTTKKITGRERALWPVVAVGDRVVWLRGWGMAADAVAAAGSAGVRIEEVVSPD
jgi:tRNA(Ile)-lysidine synthase